MPERDDLDHLIDSELARYAEPRPGLEQRILMRADTAANTPSSLLHAWRRWALAGAIAMALVFSFSVPRLHRETNTTTARVAIPEHPPASSAEPAPSESKLEIHAAPKLANMTHQVARASRSDRIIEKTRRPRLDIFPAPKPLSPQEQALVAIATAPSASARENLIESQRRLNAPLQISAIEIPPITTPDEGRK